MENSREGLGADQGVMAEKPRFGGCPECGRTDGYLNAGRTHWFFCDAHKTMWLGGINMFSGCRDETEAEQRIQGCNAVSSRFAARPL
jgi:hypothetical protein